jgi:hypothetical protein
VLAHLFTPAFLGLGSLAKTIVNDVAGGLFSALAKALMPQAVSNDILGFLGWLVSLPNLAGNARAPLTDVTTGYGDITTLVQQITWLAYGLVPVAVSTNALRFMAGTFHRGNQVDGFVKVAVSIVGLAVWPDLMRMGIDLFNTVTIGILDLPVVKTDFRNVLGVLTGATAAYGGLGAVGGLLMIGLDVIVISMIVMKVAMIAVLGILFVAAPIGIALWPIPEFSKIVQLIGMVLFGILMIPLLWVITFAAAGAFTGGILAHPGPVGKDLMSVCAGLLCFVLAIFIPKFMLGRITMIAGGVGGMTGMLRHGGGGGGVAGAAGGGGRGALERLGQMRAGLLQAGIAGSRGVGHAVSSFGAAGVGAGFGLKGLKDSGHLGKLHEAAKSTVGSTPVGKTVAATSSGLSGKWGALSDWANGSSSRTAGAARVAGAMPAALGTAYSSMQPPTSDGPRGGTAGQGAPGGGGSGRTGAPNPAAAAAGVTGGSASVRSRSAASGAAAKSGRGQDPPATGWRAAEPIYEAALKGTTGSAGVADNGSGAPSNASGAAEQTRRVLIADSHGRVDTPGTQRPGAQKPTTTTNTAGSKSTTGHDQMRRVTWGFRNRNNKN